MNYAWPYLKSTTNRGSRIFDLLGPYYRNSDTALDILCGYAALTTFWWGDYYGFDNDKDVIKEVRERIEQKNLNGNKEFFVIEDKRFNIPSKKIDVLLHLGITDGEHDCDSSHEVETSLRLSAFHEPRVIVLERSVNTKPQRIRAIIEGIERLEKYNQVLTAKFKTDLEFNSEREIKIYDHV